jgi:hypothetical protein
LEENGVALYADRMAKSPNTPETSYAQVMRFTAPTAKERDAYRKYMLTAQAAFRMPPAQTAERLKALQSTLTALNPYYQDTTPSLIKMNEARTEIATARQQLLNAL